MTSFNPHPHALATQPARRRTTLAAIAITVGMATAALVCAAPAQAHSFSAGAIEIDHPYATPTPPGLATGAVYFRNLRNRGREADRLVGASTAAARAVEIHSNTLDAQNVMRMRAIDALALPANSTVPVRHGGEVHLMLLDLKTPLKAGDEFRLMLRFEKAGDREVTVTVQQPRTGGGAHQGHKH